MSEITAKVVGFDLQPHPNADSLSIAMIHDSGWQCVVKTSDFENKKLAVYIPIDALVPSVKDDKPTQFAFLDKKGKGQPSRIKTIRLRGALSQGLLFLAPENAQLGDDFTAEWGIERYEPRIPPNLAGEQIRQPGALLKYASSENRKNYPSILVPGEQVRITEKIHGTQIKICYIHDGKFENDKNLLEFYVASNNTAKDADGTNSYSAIARELGLKEKMVELLPKFNPKTNFILCGELFGQGIQNLKYGCTQNQRKIAIFDVIIDNVYQSWETVQEITSALNIDTVPLLYRGPFSHEQALELQDGKTIIGNGAHIREGVVVTPEPERFHPKIGRVTIKYISDDYLEKQGKDPNATDGH